MPKWCSVGVCNNHHLMKSESKQQKYSFFSFPSFAKEPERRLLWANACKRVDPISKKPWKPREEVVYVYVCSEHFQTGKPVNVPGHPDYVPHLNLDNGTQSADEGTAKMGRFKRALKRKIQASASPTPCKSKAKKKVKKYEVPDEPADYPAPDDPDTPEAPEEPTEHPTASSDLESQSSQEYSLSSSPPSSVIDGILEMDFLRRERDQANSQCSKLREAFNLARLSSKTVEGDNRKCKYYTGLPWDIFFTTYNFCQSAANHKGIPKLPYIDQFFLTLVKLRHGTKFEYLADQAGLSHPSTMIDYFWKWVDLLTSQLKFIIAWPDRERIFKTIPPHFKASFPRLTGIIDCSEFYIETPGPVKARAQCYSNYKKHTTVKVLIACTPLGAVSFLSPLYGGRISDVNLVRDCGFLSPSFHNHGDQILADRGFTMKDEFAGYLGVELIVPAFCKGKSQFSSEEVQSSRNMSSVRIHVERVIGLLKNRFAVLQGVLPLRMIKSIKDEVEEADLTSADKIIMSCAILTNLTASIVYRK